MMVNGDIQVGGVGYCETVLKNFIFLIKSISQEEKHSHFELTQDAGATLISSQIEDRKRNDDKASEHNVHGPSILSASGTPCCSIMCPAYWP